MSNQPSLYIIEDDTKLREMLAEYMTNQGFQVTTFATGETAPEQILLNQPDLVLLDLMLPGENGLTICRQIRAQFLGKILMLTASDDDFDHVAALETGADEQANKTQSAFGADPHADAPRRANLRQCRCYPFIAIWRSFT